eukprot:1956306-Rhodomonas_salina.3
MHETRCRTRRRCHTGQRSVLGISTAVRKRVRACMHETREHASMQHIASVYTHQHTSPKCKKKTEKKKPSMIMPDSSARHLRRREAGGWIRGRKTLVRPAPTEGGAAGAQ